jgi:hypothetical protein
MGLFDTQSIENGYRIAPQLLDGELARCAQTGLSVAARVVADHPEPGGKSLELRIPHLERAAQRVHE